MVRYAGMVLEKIRQVGGDLQFPDDGAITLGAYDGSDWLTTQGSPAVNNRSTVRWNVRLEPGQEKTLTVDYHYYTRH